MASAAASVSVPNLVESHSASAGTSTAWWLLLALPVASGGDFSLHDIGGYSWAIAGAFVLIALSMAIVWWAAPGGPAWGKFRRNRKNMNDAQAIPGPKGLPIIGSLFDMRGLAHRSLAKLSSKHGAKRLMAFSLGDTLAIVSSHPDVAKDILNSSVFADRPIKESAYSLLFHRAIGFAPYSDYWRNLRRIAATHLFSPKRIESFEGHRQDVISSVLAAVDKSMAENGVVSIKTFLQQASLNNIMMTVFGRTYNFFSPIKDEETKELMSMVREGYDLLGLLNWGDHLSVLGFFDFQRIRRRCQRLVPRVNAFVQRIIDDHRASPAGDSCKSDFVDTLLSLQDKDRLSDSDMIAVLWEMIFRGTDTVAILLEWIMARVVMHQDVQAKIHAEIDAVVGSGRRVMEEDVKKMEYMQAVVKEVLRVHPPGPLLSWARLAIHDTNVDGHMVPAGTTAMVNMWSITHDEAVWGADAKEFKPERFVVSEGGEDINIMGSDLRLAPFGSGRRVCPGKAMALATTHLWLAQMLQQYKWLPHEGEVDLSEVLKLSCEMKSPLAVKVIRRNQEAAL